MSNALLAALDTANGSTAVENSHETAMANAGAIKALLGQVAHVLGERAQAPEGEVSLRLGVATALEAVGEGLLEPDVVAARSPLDTAHLFMGLRRLIQAAHFQPRSFDTERHRFGVRLERMAERAGATNEDVSED